MSYAGWYALHVRRQYEFIVPAFLKAKGYDVLSPSYKSRRSWSDRIKEIEQPLFPGYVFCQFDPTVHNDFPVIKTPGVLKIVGIGHRPAPLDPVEVNSVRLAVEAGLCSKPFPYLHAGVKLRILRGPLMGLEGTLLKEKSTHVLILSVSLLQRSISVAIDKQLVECIAADTECVVSRNIQEYVGNSKNPGNVCVEENPPAKRPSL